MIVPVVTFFIIVAIILTYMWYIDREVQREANELFQSTMREIIDEYKKRNGA